MSKKEPAEPVVEVSNGGPPSYSDPVNVVTSTDPEPAVESSNGGHVLPEGHPDAKPAEPEPAKASGLIPPDAETATSTAPTETG